MSQAMSFESPRTSVFTFQSSVHSSHVLRCLNEQRQKDILCDLTVVVETQSFRAHRSVLASCSDYFHSRVTSLVGQGLVITLPDEVTVEGFEPLLQFAYTAKLLFTKENILEIRNCATILGFHNLDKACFEFLIPKFFDSNRSAQATQRKVCCKSKYWKERSSRARYGSDDDDDYKEESVEVDSPEALLKKQDAKGSGPSAKPTAEVSGNCDLMCPKLAMPTDSSLLCPRYRKFQMACKFQLTSDGCPSSRLLCPGSDGGDRPGGRESDLDKASENEVAVAAVCPPSVPPLPVNSSAAGFGGMPDSSYSPSVGSVGAEPDCCPLGPFEICCMNPMARGEEDSDNKRLMGSMPTDPSPSSSLVLKDQSGEGERSSVEREVAEHLAKGFWPDLGHPQTEHLNPLAQSTKGESPGCHWFKQLDRMTECPFLRDLGDQQGQLPECEGASQTEKRPYDSSLNSGDDSDFDTEGDNESYINVRAHEVQLPFSVERIASLSRNDFQQILKQHPLTREQLDFVHDVRRRSKNRIAAQRCRKRKLDCIHNLECEIDKLRFEKEKLMQERNQLNQMKLKTWQSLSGLYQVCSEAALQPEQLQVLARYSSPDCPLSALVTPMPSTSASPGAHNQDQIPPSTCPVRLLACPPMDLSAGKTHKGLQAPPSPRPGPAPTHSRTVDNSAQEGCGPSSITDVCLDMNSKCTTDE
ncbi:hypothetical protein MATL_G00049670 [Megalops atlanticus]|uniref:Uncharacterized protein n=1 Tax=Megalops atlanticus TaxID=7932 RepID=A0A9D3QCE9_MEGAT|nr:hypothetical protein MATL_G00049670 [Megalops atlanticus]